MFVRREFVYLGADHIGVLRMGETDGVIGTFDEGGRTTGVFLSPTGTTVGGDLEGTTVGGWMAPYYGAQSGNEYATEKLFYDSPSFFGFDFAFEYSPTAFNGFGNPALVRTSSNYVTNGSSVERNIYAAGVRYSGTFGPAAVLAYGVYMGSGHVNSPNGAQFDNLSLGMFGANVTVAGLSVFGNVMHGAFNGVLGLKPKGAPDGTGVTGGVKYSFGPFGVGGVYSQLDDQGSYTQTGISQSHAWVAYLAATYSAAPGLTFYADYGYGQTHQGSSDGRTQGFLVGTKVTW